MKARFILQYYDDGMNEVEVKIEADLSDERGKKHLIQSISNLIQVPSNEAMSDEEWEAIKAHDGNEAHG